jgi:hypothetical protein
LQNKGKKAARGVKLTFLFLAIFTPIKNPLFLNPAEAGDEGQFYRVFEGVVLVAEAFIGAPVHALGPFLVTSLKSFFRSLWITDIQDSVDDFEPLSFPFICPAFLLMF